MKPSLRSKLNNIQLLLLAKYLTVAEFGIDRILKPIIEDIKKLESVLHYFLYCMFQQLSHLDYIIFNTLYMSE